MYNFSEHKQNITQQVTIGNLLLAGILSCKGAWCSQCCEQCRLFLHGLHSSPSISSGIYSPSSKQGDPHKGRQLIASPGKTLLGKVREYLL